MPLIEQGQWQRSSKNPLLSPVLVWEGTAVQEPCVIFEAATWKLWYRGSWAGPYAIGLATCPGSADPADPANWTKHPANPVYTGAGVHAPCQPWVVRDPTTGLYLLYYTDFGASGDMFLATSPDGLAWSLLAGGPIIARSGGITSWGNRSVWIEGTIWYMLLEGRVGAAPWAMYLATSSDGRTWALANGGAALASLPVVAGGTASAARVARVNGGIHPGLCGRYHVWYHASSAAGLLPTQIYSATSLDRVNWTRVTPGPLLGPSLGSGFEVDQVAGPCVVEQGGRSYLFYDGDDNPGHTARIGVATYGGTLEDLLCGPSMSSFFGIGDFFGGLLKLDSVQAVLGADVNLAVSGTYYDGPSIALGIGTWLVLAEAMLQIDTTGTNANLNSATADVKLWDGATVYAATEATTHLPGYRVPMPLPPKVVVLAAPATLKLSAVTDFGSANTFMRANGLSNGGPGPTTSIAAIKLA